VIWSTDSSVFGFGRAYNEGNRKVALRDLAVFVPRTLGAILREIMTTRTAC
jgi:hypothetical protein